MQPISVVVRAYFVVLIKNWHKFYPPISAVNGEYIKIQTGFVIGVKNNVA